MEFISEAVIEQVIEQIDSGEKSSEAILALLETEQPVLLSYIFSEEFGAFPDQERSFILYLLLVIYESVRQVHPVIPRIDAETLSEAEEKNWETLQEVTSRRFRERLDAFFAETGQEDLLAFLGDALIDEDESGLVTKEGREPIFVTLKAIIDCLEAAL